MSGSLPDNVAQAPLPFDRRRTQELFRYLRATSVADKFSTQRSDTQTSQPSTQPQGDHLRTAEVSSDPTLTALAQLAVLKLGVKRAFVSLIDHNTQTILAEATRSVSLNDASDHAPGDELYLGATSIPLDFGLTPHSISIFTEKDPSHYVSTSNVTLNATRFVILNLAEEPRYSQRVFVTGAIHMRFIAIVPITSPSGYVIGSFAVTDTEPRANFSESDFATLQEIARTAMDHLNMVAATDELGRAERLLEAVNLFIQGESSLCDGSFRDFMMRRAAADASVGDEVHSSRVGPEGMAQVAVSRRDRMAFYLGAHEQETVSTPTSRRRRKASTTSLPTFRSSISNPSTSESSDYPNAQDLRNINIGEVIDENFARASNLIRESMDLEGVVFLSAGVSSRDGQTDEASASSIDDITSGTIDSSLVSDLSRPAATSIGRGEAMARRLGYSMNIRADPLQDAIPVRQFSLPQGFLRRLFMRYPYGKTFHFDANGRVMSLPEDDQLAQDFQQRSARVRRIRKISRKETQDNYNIDAALLRCFPRVRSLIFCPLWDSQNERWFGCGLCWTTDHLRSLTGSELAYVTSFSNSLMSEIARLQTWATDVAKSDFISSISHELRSPLHGILGSAELLSDMVSETRQSQLISMIQHCGTTLLDTMNHLLDFAKINSLTKKSAGEEQPSANSMQRGGGIDLVATFDIATMIEELIEGVLVGERFKTTGADRIQIGAQRSRQGSGNDVEMGSSINPPPTTVLNIVRAPIWVIKSEVGAWKRILQNLLGNALKYTKQGIIEVSLSWQHIENLFEEANVPAMHTLVLSVKDTGQGISKHYLENHLYKAFAQENTLSDGTGLGLSIVKQVVVALGGVINIDSDVGIGTEVEITVPVEFVPEAPGAGLIEDYFRLRWQNRELCLLCLDSPSSDRQFPTSDPRGSGMKRSSVFRTIAGHGKDWFGLKVHQGSIDESKNADVVAIMEEDLEAIAAEDDQTWQSRTIWKILVICSGTNVDRTSVRSTNWRVEYLPSPYGPKRMGETLVALLDREHNEPGSSSRRHRWISGLDTKSTAVNRSGSGPSTPSVPKPRKAIEGQSSGDSSVLRVLCVDDNSINLKMLTACMKKLNYEYEAATNGQEAFNSFRDSKDPFDYVFMDISMPVMDGLTATRLIRQLEDQQTRASKRTTIIALTGLGSEKTQQEAMYSGVDHFLTKPVAMQKLKELLSTEALPPTDG